MIDKLRLTKKALRGFALIVSPSWLSNGHWIWPRARVEIEPSVLDCPAALRLLYGVTEVAQWSDDKAEGVLHKPAAHEHAVTDWIIRKARVEAVRLNPRGWLSRAYVEQFSLWGATLFSRDGSAEGIFFDAQKPAERSLGIMPMRLDDEKPPEIEP